MDSYQRARIFLRSYAGAAPGEVDGVVQLNVLIPASVAPGGMVPVVIGTGGQTGATMAVN